MIPYLCELWPYLVGGLIGWLLAGLLARLLKYGEPPLEKVIEKRIEVDNPKHLALIAKLEGENSKIASLVSKVSQYESNEKGAIQKTIEVDNPKHLARIKQLEAENKELSAFKEKLLKTIGRDESDGGKQ